MAIREFLNPQEVLRQIDIRGGMFIGDFGVGSGHFTIEVAKIVGNYGKVFAVDIREAALESVKSRARLENMANIVPIRANLEVAGSTGIADDSLDLVLLITVLSQTNKKDDILKESFRTLKRGGMLVLIDWAEGGVAFDVSAEYRATKEEMQKLAQNAGFRLDKEIDVKSFHYGLLFIKP